MMADGSNSSQPSSGIGVKSATSAKSGNSANNIKATKDAKNVKDQAKYKLEKPVFLIGFMGAGKTSVSRRLARICGLSCVDVDSYIVRREGKEIKDIFAEGGEAAFRDIETLSLKEVVEDLDPMLISCGGGIVVTPVNLEIMDSSGVVVYLKVDAQEASKRVSNTESRPLFKDNDSVQQLLDVRIPIYEEAAHMTIDTSGKTPTAIAFELKGMLMQEDILKKAE